ncbi:MAG: putative DNA binding domain-containing protein [Clostridiales bacterium]|nr:putative DNA binding domain-containing protein [Clostridiales bacterium]
MQEHELQGLAKKIKRAACETRTLELKSAAGGSPSKLYDTLSSFSNQDDGGIIVFGIDEKSGFLSVGVLNAQELMKSVNEQCKQMTPIVRPLFTVAEVDGKQIVSAEIPGADISDRPVFYSGKGRLKGSYVRVGDSDEPMTEYEIYSYDAYRRRVKDDVRPIEGTGKGDLDTDKTAEFLKKVREQKPKLARLSDGEILKLTGIVKEDKLTVTGLLVLGRYPQAVLPQFAMTAIVVPGTEIGDTDKDGSRFIANKRIEGTLDEMLDEARRFVARNMRVKTIIDRDGVRKDKDEYPLTAVREALLNSLMHRDYSIHTEGSPIRIVMYYDRIEITNPGGLYGRLTIDNLGKTQADTRNQTLATVLEGTGLAENRYSGIPTIRREMREAGLPDPKFETMRGDFIVTFYNGQADKKGEGSSIEDRLIEFCEMPKTRTEIAGFIGKTQYYTLKTYVEPLVESGKLRLLIPNVPKSRNQKYVKV